MIPTSPSMFFNASSDWTYLNQAPGLPPPAPFSTRPTSLEISRNTQRACGRISPPVRDRGLGMKQRSQQRNVPPNFGAEVALSVRLCSPNVEQLSAYLTGLICTDAAD